MKIGVLFSGGKDSTYSAWLAKKEGHELVCLITLFSENKDSYMFHTPLIELTKKQAELMNLPIIIDKTAGEKEKELADLERAIKKAIFDYKIEGIVTGAVASNYQAERIKKICDKLGIKCLNPIWGVNQVKLLEELIKNKFEIIIIGVAAYPLNEKWIGRKIDAGYIKEIAELQRKYRINPNGEGGETESLVLNCPLFKKKLKIGKITSAGKGNSWRAEIKQ
jgi:asparagine synthase (glutamine-hydrolysing)